MHWRLLATLAHMVDGCSMPRAHFVKRQLPAGLMRRVLLPQAAAALEAADGLSDAILLTKVADYRLS